MLFPCLVSLQNGIHTLERKSTLTPKTVKMMKAQDLAYLQSQQSSDAKRIDRFKQSMHFLMEDEQAEEQGEDEEEEDDFADDDDDEPSRKKSKSSSGQSAIRSKHVVFVEDASAVKSFTPSSYFQTAPELVGRTYNRLRTDQLAAPVLLNNTQDQILAHRAAAATTSKHGPSAAAASLASSKSLAQSHALQARADQGLLAGYSEIASRLTRKRKLGDAVAKLQLEKHLAGKGPRKRIVPAEEDRFGDVDEKKVVYKWKMQRKK